MSAPRIVPTGVLGGIAGKDGSNVLPTDTAIKQAIQNPASQTAAALTASYGDGQLSREALARSKRLAAEYAGFARQTVPVTIGALTAFGGPSALETSLGTVTWLNSTSTFTSSAPHGMVVGTPIRITGKTGGMYLDGGTYYVRTVPSPTTFTLIPSHGTDPNTDNPQDVGSDGSGTVYKNVPTTEPFYDNANSRVNLSALVVDGKPVRRGSTYPGSDMIIPDPTTITYVPGVLAGTGLTAHTIYDGNAVEGVFFNDGSNIVRVYADGILIDTVTSAQLATAGVTPGNLGTKLYTFPAARPRVLTQQSYVGALYGWTRIASRPLSKPTFNTGAVWAIHGDSFAEGTGDDTGIGYVGWVKRILGLNNVYRCGSGSTGYKNDGERLALEDRYTNDIIALAADVNVIAMGINDDPDSHAPTAAAVTTAAAAIWDAVRAGLPASELIIVGPWPKNGGAGDQGGLGVLDADLAAAATARGLRYISPIQEGWTFTLHDGPHPDPAGHQKIGARLAGHLALPWLPTTAVVSG